MRWLILDFQEKFGQQVFNNLSVLARARGFMIYIFLLEEQFIAFDHPLQSIFTILMKRVFIVFIIVFKWTLLRINLLGSKNTIANFLLWNVQHVFTLNIWCFSPLNKTRTTWVDNYCNRKLGEICVHVGIHVSGYF